MPQQPMPKPIRRALVKKMAKAAIDALTDEEWEALNAWAEENLAGDLGYALEDGIKLVIAWD